MNEQKIEEDKLVENPEEMKDIANDIFLVMSNDPDPRFQNSKFLGFLKNLRTGRVEIRDNKVLVNENIPENMIEGIDLISRYNETRTLL